MKIIIGDGIILYISKSYIKNINLKDRDVAEKFINKVIDIYKIDLSGYFDVKIYIDKYYGFLITIKKESNDYLSYFNDEINMNIEVIDDVFLYKVDDIYFLNSYLKSFVIYEFKGDIYLKIDNNSKLNMGVLIENSDIIFGNKVKEIIKKGTLIKKEVIT